MCKIGFNTNKQKKEWAKTVDQIVVMAASIVLLLIWVPLRNTAAPNKLIQSAFIQGISIQGKSIQANTTL